MGFVEKQVTGCAWAAGVLERGGWMTIYKDDQAEGFDAGIYVEVKSQDLELLKALGRVAGKKPVARGDGYALRLWNQQAEEFLSSIREFTVSRGGEIDLLLKAHEVRESVKEGFGQGVWTAKHRRSIKEKRRKLVSVRSS